MISMVALVKRKAGLSPEQFREYYETRHVPLANKHVTHLFADYRRNYVNFSAFIAQQDDSATAAEPSAYDAITTFLFESQEKYDEFLRLVETPEVKTALAEDEANFVDRANSLVMLCDNIKTS